MAAALLEAATTGLQSQGFEWAEAYPRRDADGAAESHYGPRSMFEAAGFRLVREDGAGSLVVRKALR